MSPPKNYKRRKYAKKSYKRYASAPWTSSRSCSSLLSKPPTFNSLLYKRHRFRFAVSNTAGYFGTITVADIMGALGGVCTTGNSVLSSFNAGFKIHSVEIWGPNFQSLSTGAFNPTTIELSWGAIANDQVAPLGSTANVGGSWLPRSLVDNAMGSSQSSHIKSYPPKNSQLAGWMLPQGTNQGAGTVFTLNVPESTIIDLDVSAIEFGGLSMNTFTSSIATGTVGHTYYLALDGPSSNLIAPIGLITTH